MLNVSKTYIEFINNNSLPIAPVCQNRDSGCQRHHIIPKCVGGSNKKENLVILTKANHIAAHKILAADNPDNKKLQLAWAKMSEWDTTCGYFPAEDIAAAKAVISKFNSGEQNPMFGSCRLDTDSPNHKAIRCLETGKVYQTCKSAAEDLQISSSHLSDHLRGRKYYDSVGGYHFEYVFKEE